MPPIRPSPIFLGVVALTLGLAAYMAVNDITNAFFVFAFVVSGWILSLILHEFAHAITAFIGGDRSVADKGYLTLDPTKYTDLSLSLVMPIVFVLMGGIGLPGGAVWINQGAIRSPAMRTVVSLAGPATNVLVAIVCLAPIGAGLVTLEEQASLTVALAFLGFLQIGAVVLNMIPVPGLDGYGAIDPHLSPATRRAIAPVGRYGIIAVFILLFFVPPANEAFWDLVTWGSGLFDVDRQLVSFGYGEFQFWDRP